MVDPLKKTKSHARDHGELKKTFKRRCSAFRELIFNGWAPNRPLFLFYQQSEVETELYKGSNGSILDPLFFTSLWINMTFLFYIPKVVMSFLNLPTSEIEEEIADLYLAIDIRKSIITNMRDNSIRNMLLRNNVAEEERLDECKEEIKKRQLIITTLTCSATGTGVS